MTFYFNVLSKSNIRIKLITEILEKSLENLLISNFIEILLSSG